MPTGDPNNLKAAMGSWVQRNSASSSTSNNGYWINPPNGTPSYPSYVPGTAAGTGIYPTTTVYQVPPACQNSHLNATISVNVAGLFEVYCPDCFQTFTIARFPIELIQEKVTHLVYQVIDADDDEDLIDELLLELIIICRHAETLLEELHSLKELADALAKARKNP